MTKQRGIKSLRPRTIFPTTGQPIFLETTMRQNKR